MTAKTTDQPGRDVPRPGPGVAAHGPVGHEVAALVTAMDALLAAPVEGLLCAGEIAVLHEQQARLDAALLDRIETVNAALAYTADGSRSMAAWLGKRTRASRAAAASQVKLGRQLTGRPLVHTALTQGRISAAHARVLCQALAKLSRYLIGTGFDIPALLAELEPVFLDLALLTDPHTLQVELDKRIQAYAPLPEQRDNDSIDAARTASLHPAFDGGWDLTAALGEHAGQILAAALAAYRRTDHSSGDPRTPGQRQADALAGICQYYLDSAGAPCDRGVAPHVLIHVPLARFEAHQLPHDPSSRPILGPTTGAIIDRLPDPHRDPLFSRDGHLLTPTEARESRAGLAPPGTTPPGTAPPGTAPPGTAAPPGLAPPGDPNGDRRAAAFARANLHLIRITDPQQPPDTWPAPPGPAPRPAPGPPPGPALIVPVATYADGRPVPERTLAQVLCDARLTRVVLDAQSMPIDLGRTSRYYTWQQTQAALIRYQNVCATAGCHAPAHQLEMHHPTPWSEGGTTSNDAVPLCLHHHTWIHHGRSLQLTTGATLGPHAWITQTAAA